MNSLERRATWSLASIYALRMLGLFMLFPVLALYAEGLGGSTPTLIGLALGAYGMTQGLLQIPSGMLADRIGRKPVIAGGLLVFALGSLVAGLATSVWGIVIGRAIQGAGAIAAAIMALLADLTREEQRTKAMALIGMSIGASFMVALVAGPLLGHWIGVPGIFFATAVLALVMIGVLYLVVPEPVVSIAQGPAWRTDREGGFSSGQLGRIFTDGQLPRLAGSILLLHLIMTANFVVMPLLLRDRMALEPAQHWLLYLPVMLLSVAGMVPLIIIGEKGGKLKQVFVLSIAGLGLAEALFAVVGTHFWLLAAGLLLFFIAFNVLEASLPSLVSKVAPAAARGTALGVYSTAQFAGAFVGGVTGGWVYGHFGVSAVFSVNAALAVLWLVLVAGFRAPVQLLTRMINVGNIDPQRARELSRELAEIAGVAEAVVVPADGIAYLKVDSRVLNPAALEPYSVSQ